MPNTPRATRQPFAIPAIPPMQAPAPNKNSGMTKLSPETNDGMSHKMNYAGIKNPDLGFRQGAIAYTDFDNLQEVFAATVDFDRPDYDIKKYPMPNAGYDGVSHRISDTNGVPKRDV